MKSADTGHEERGADVGELARASRDAARRLRGRVRATEARRSEYLSAMSGARVYLKLECLQYTGAFKLRGAMSRLLAMSDDERTRGAVTASTGNHGRAVAYGCRALGMRAVVFVPETVTVDKKKAIEGFGAEVHVAGGDNCQAQAHARAYAAEQGMVMVPPYNDAHVVAGQGTIGVELVEQVGNIDAALVCVGGGGLVSGIGGYLKWALPKVKIYGCSPRNSAAMIECIHAGEIVTVETSPTLSDGSAGGNIVPGSITFDLCRELVDTFDTVTEEEIRDALLLFLKTHHILIEGSAAVPIATFLRRKDEFKGKDVVIVLCGANIDIDTLQSVLCGRAG